MTTFGAVNDETFIKITFLSNVSNFGLVNIQWIKGMDD